MRRKKVSGTADYIIPIGVIGLGALVLYKMGIFSGTATGTGANNGVAEAQTVQSWTTAYNQSVQSTPQQLSDTQLNSMILEMLQDANSNTSIFAGSSYQEDIVTQMSNLGNITDLNRLGMLWGVRAVPTSQFNLCNTLDIDCTKIDLGAFLKVTLTADQLAEVNQDLAGNGISYTFS
jgi:hypothetical protein